MTACGEAATPTREGFPPEPGSGSISRSGLPSTTINSPDTGQTTIPASGLTPPGESTPAVSPQSSAIQIIANPTSLKVGDSVSITGTGGQTPILDYTLLLNATEFAKDSSTPKDEVAGNDSKQVFGFVSASRRGNGVTFVLKATQPGKVTVSLKASGEASFSSGGKPISVLFTTVSNSTELTVGS